MGETYSQALTHGLKEWQSVPVSPYVKNFTDERKHALLELLESEGEIQVLKFHQSLCPGCVDEEKFDTMKIDCVTFVKNNKVWMKKQCPQHGAFKEVYWSDWEMYQKAERFQDPGIKILNPHIDKNAFDINCPTDCGLCVEHESHTGLGNIVVTNRCDLTCWYCFFYAKEGEPIYEPTMDQIKFMLSRMRNEKPVGANSVQFTGGEPTLRDDLPDIVAAAKAQGYNHVQLNTNGIRLSREPAFAVRLREAGVSNLYMSFDGVTPQTNPKNYWEAQGAIESCHKAGIGVVLVPTVIGGINDHELGDIIRFGAGNIHAVRSVNFQPVSLVGRMPEKLRRQQRITIPGAIKKIEEQTDGQIGREAWFPVPCAKQVTDFIEAIKQEPKYRLSIHFACGMATYVFKDQNNKLIPITDFFNIEGFFDYLGELTRELNGSQHRNVRKYFVLAKLLKTLPKFVDKEKAPKNLNIVKMLSGAVGGGNYHGLADFHHKSLFLGMMHFQDPYNWDIDRIHKCDIHYATPDGRVLPFCTFNVIPELYRDRIQRKFSIPAAEWEKKTGQSLNADKHHRTFTKEQMKAIVDNFNAYRKTMTKPKVWTDWGDEDAEPAAASTVNPVVGAVVADAMSSLVQLGGSSKFGVSQPRKAAAKHEESADACGCGTGGHHDEPKTGGCGC